MGLGTGDCEVPAVWCAGNTSTDRPCAAHLSEEIIKVLFIIIKICLNIMQEVYIN